MHGFATSCIRHSDNNVSGELCAGKRLPHLEERLGFEIVLNQKVM